MSTFVCAPRLYWLASGHKVVGVGGDAGWSPGSFFFFTFPGGFVEEVAPGVSPGDEDAKAGGLLAGASQPLAKAAAIETMRQRDTIRIMVS